MPKFERSSFGKPNPNDVLKWSDYHQGIMYVMQENFVIMFVDDKMDDEPEP